MLNRIFPKQFDNAYRGHWLAIWIFVVLILLHAAQRLIVISDPRETLLTADALPLYSYGAGGAQTVVSFAVLLALSSLVLPLQSVVVLIRYRAMIPFMYLCMLMVSISGKVFERVYPVASADTHAIATHAQNGFYVPNSSYFVGLFISAMTVMGFILSLLQKSNSPEQPLSESARSP